MALKANYDKAEDVPEPVRNLYVEKDGKFWLDAEGIEDTAPLKNALKGERDEVKKLKGMLKDFDDLKKRAGDYDALKAKLDEMGDADLLAKGAEGIDELVAKRTQRALDAAAAKTAAAEEAKAAAEKAGQETAARLHRIVLDHSVQAAAAKAGVRATAIEDIIRRGRDVFTVEDTDGDLKVVARDSNTVDTKGHIVTVDTWLKDVLPNDAPHYWEADKGGGAGGGRGGGGGIATVRRGDQAAIDQNWEAIRDGKVRVVD